MYGENKKIFENLPHIVLGNIYFLAERRRVRVIPESIQLSPDGHVSVSFLLENGKTIPSCFPFAPTIIGLGKKFSEVYGNAATLQKYVVGVQSQEEYLSKKNLASEIPLVGVSLDRSEQTKKNVALRVHTPDGRVGNLSFSIHSLLSTFAIDIGDYPRVLYIGKSEHLADRIYRHERIQEALATIDDDSDLYLYAFQFDANKYTISDLPNRTPVIRKDLVNDISTENQISLVEMSLINYFKPPLNINYKNTDITINPVFVAALNGRYNRLVLEVDHDSGFWNFGTGHVKEGLRHQVEYPVHC